MASKSTNSCSDTNKLHTEQPTSVNYTNHSSYVFLPLPLHPYIYPLGSGLIVGIVVKKFLCISLASFIFLSCIFVGFTLSAYKLLDHYGRTVITAFSIGFCLGMSALYLQCHRHFQQVTVVPCSALMGTITDITPLDHATLKQRITLRITQISTNNTDAHCTLNKKNICLYTIYPLKQCHVDDTIFLHNITLKTPHEDEFGWYLLKEDISAVAFLYKKPYYLITHRPSWSIRRFIHDQRTAITQSIMSKLSSSCAPLFSSLFLGNRNTHKESLQKIGEQFRWWGISHHLARSGLHMVIFAFVWQQLLSFIPISFRIKESVLLLLGIIYWFFSWPSISFIRAFFCFAIYRFCALVGSPSSIMYTLALVCTTVLLYNPAQLFFLDFQLSFWLTFALAWFNHYYMHYQIITQERLS